MEMLASLLVGKPGNILFVTGAFLLACLIVRFTSPANRRGFNSLVVASVAWAAYAGWEWLVQARTPKANIRVDLLVIWPMLAILSARASYRVLRPR
jgi:hypothetical protein